MEAKISAQKAQLSVIELMDLFLSTCKWSRIAAQLFFHAAVVNGLKSLESLLSYSSPSPRPAKLWILPAIRKMISPTALDHMAVLALLLRLKTFSHLLGYQHPFSACPYPSSATACWSWVHPWLQRDFSTLHLRAVSKENWLGNRLFIQDEPSSSRGWETSSLCIWAEVNIKKHWKKWPFYYTCHHSSGHTFPKKLFLSHSISATIPKS